eukprot:403334153
MDEWQMTGILQESNINQNHLVPNKPNQINENIVTKHRNFMDYQEDFQLNDKENQKHPITLKNLQIKQNSAIQTITNDTKKPSQKKILAPQCQIDYEVIDKCKENMRKRRLLFQNDRAEKKDINDTSINNTALDQESIVMVSNQQQQRQRIQEKEGDIVMPSKISTLYYNSKSQINSEEGKKEIINEIEEDFEEENKCQIINQSSSNSSQKRSVSSSLISDEISQSWMNDPEWHRFSNKLEKVAKYQNKLQLKRGFDPVQYFGGIQNDSELENQLVKDPRFSEMFRDELHQRTSSLSKELVDIITYIKQGIGKDISDIPEAELIKLIKYHKQQISEQNGQTEQDLSSKIHLKDQTHEVTQKEQAQNFSRDTFASEIQMISNHKPLYKNEQRDSNSTSCSQQDNKDPQHSKNLNNNQISNFYKNDKQSLNYQIDKIPLTERHNKNENLQQQKSQIYKGKINLFKLTKNNSSSSLNRKTNQSKSRSNSRESKVQTMSGQKSARQNTGSALKMSQQSQHPQRKSSVTQASQQVNIGGKIPLYKQRNQLSSGLTSLMSNQSIKSDIYNKYIPNTDRSHFQSKNINENLQQTFQSLSSLNTQMMASCLSNRNEQSISSLIASSNQNHQQQSALLNQKNILSFQSNSSKNARNSSLNKQSIGNSSQKSKAQSITKMKTGKSEEGLDKINKFYQNDSTNQLQSQKSRSKSPLSGLNFMNQTQKSSKQVIHLPKSFVSTSISNLKLPLQASTQKNQSKVLNALSNANNSQQKSSFISTNSMSSNQNFFNVQPQQKTQSYNNPQIIKQPNQSNEINPNLRSQTANNLKEKYSKANHNLDQNKAHLKVQQLYQNQQTFEDFGDENDSHYMNQGGKTQRQHQFQIFQYEANNNPIEVSFSNDCSVQQQNASQISKSQQSIKHSQSAKYLRPSNRVPNQTNNRMSSDQNEFIDQDFIDFADLETQKNSLGDENKQLDLYTQQLLFNNIKSSQLKQSPHQIIQNQSSIKHQVKEMPSASSNGYSNRSSNRVSGMRDLQINMEMPGLTTSIFGFASSTSCDQNNNNNLGAGSYDSLNPNAANNFFVQNNSNVYMMTSPHFSNAERSDKFISQ